MVDLRQVTGIVIDVVGNLQVTHRVPYKVKCRVVTAFFQGINHVSDVGAAVVVARRVVILVVTKLIISEVDLHDGVDCPLGDLSVKRHLSLAVDVGAHNCLGHAGTLGGPGHLIFRPGTRAPAVDEDGWYGRLPVVLDSHRPARNVEATKGENGG